MLAAKHAKSRGAGEAARCSRFLGDDLGFHWSSELDHIRSCILQVPTKSLAITVRKPIVVERPSAGASNAWRRWAKHIPVHLSEADLRTANLCRADLSMTNLGGANLRGWTSVKPIFTRPSSAGPVMPWFSIKEA
jgi:hypothetical protein